MPCHQHGSVGENKRQSMRIRGPIRHRSERQRQFTTLPPNGELRTDRNFSVAALHTPMNEAREKAQLLIVQHVVGGASCEWQRAPTLSQRRQRQEKCALSLFPSSANSLARSRALGLGLSAGVRYCAGRARPLSPTKSTHATTAVSSFIRAAPKKPRR